MRKGFTLIEGLIILCMIFILIGLLLPACIVLEEGVDKIDHTNKATQQVENLEKRLSAFITEDGYFLQADMEDVVDPWENTIKVEYIGERNKYIGLIITSAGADGEFNTPDDIVRSNRLMRKDISNTIKHGVRDIRSGWREGSE